MYYSVNSQCIGCGMCTVTCPAVFTMTEEGTATASQEEVTGRDRDQAEAAMNSCPVGAIERKKGDT